MNNFDLSGSYAAEKPCARGSRESGDLEIALSCMDPRIPYFNKGTDYVRAIKIAGGNNYAPQEIYEFAKMLGGVRVNGKRITVAESHPGCGGGLAGYLKYLELLGTPILKEDAKQQDVDKYSKNYARSLADIMAEQNNGEPEVRAVHLRKKDMDEFQKQHKSTSGVIYVSREPFNSAAYRNQNGEKLIGGFTIGGAGLPMEKYLESVALALNLAIGADKHGDSHGSCERRVNVVVVGKSGNRNHIHTPRSLTGSSDLFYLLERIARTEKYAGKVAITQLPVRPDCKNFSANTISRYVPDTDAPYAQIPSPGLWENILAEPTSAMQDVLRL